MSFSDSHQCASDPTHLFYRIREKGGVPVAYEQIHAMVLLGYKSIKCQKPEVIDDVTTAECPHLSQATLPHLGAMGVKRWGCHVGNDCHCSSPLFFFSSPAAVSAVRTRSSGAHDLNPRAISDTLVGMVVESRQTQKCVCISNRGPHGKAP